MEITIRRAEAPDVPRMLDLVRELALFEQEPEAVTVTAAEMLDAGFGPEPVWFGWVAEENGRILGMAMCYTRYSTWRGPTLYLEDIIVTENARGRKLGERLFKTCVEHAAARGYKGMRWQVLDWNTDAIRFYERFGASISAGWLNGELSLQRIRAIAGA